MIRIPVVTMFLWCGLFVDLAYGQDPPPSPDESHQREAEFLIRGMQSARQGLKRAVASIAGVRRVVRTGHEDLNVTDEPIQALHALEFDSGRFRYDHHHPVQIGFVGAGEDGKAIDEVELGFAVQKLNSVRNGEYLALYEDSGESATHLDIVAPDSDWRGMAETHQFVDIRSFGLIDFLEFTGGPRRYDPNGRTEILLGEYMISPFEEVVARYLETPVTGISRDGNIATVSFPFYDLSINESEGFTPVRLINTFGKSRLLTEVAWQQSDNLWLPVEFFIEYADWPSVGDVASYSYTIEWSSVNEALPERLFSYHDFPDVKEGTKVKDHVNKPSGASTSTIGHWVNGRLEKVAVTTPTPLIRERDGDSGRLSLRVLFAINVTVLVVIAFLVFFYRRKNAR